MTAIEAVPSPSDLDVHVDPAGAVVALLEQSKLMLAQATRLEDVTEWRARADALATYTRQRDLGNDAQLAALEIVRRAERRIGQLIREGQERGEIRKPGNRAGRIQPHSKISPLAFVDKHVLCGAVPGTGAYAMTDGVSDEDFEEAIEQARAEENLSRANVVRKVRKTPTPTIASPLPGGLKQARLTNHQRMLGNLVESAAGLEFALSGVDPTEIPPVPAEWIVTLKSTASALSSLARRLEPK